MGITGEVGAEHAIHIDAVAEGDHKDRKYVIAMLPPAEWVRGDPHRDALMPEEKYRSLPQPPSVSAGR